ncbi:MAG: aminotransferase class V-fold PLP-dependent enzyme [Paracoccaceae bacterium]
MAKPNAPAEPTADGEGYLLYHSIGQYPGKAADMTAAMAAFASVWAAPDDEQWGYALGVRQRFIDRWSDIIHAPSGSVTSCESVTAGVASLFGALPDRVLRGKRVLVAGDCFPSVHFLLTGLQERLGFTLDTVPLRQGASWVADEDVIRHWGPDVGVALLTWVSSTSSHRIDLEAMVAHGRQMGSVIGVDITQGAGLLAFDVMAPVVDFTVSTSLKWMCGTPGAGILHVAPALCAECQPSLRGWFSQANPFSWDLDKFAYAPDIRRFDHGTPGIMACAASLPALDWHAGQSIADLTAHNARLSAQILDGVTEIGLSLASPRDPAERGGSVMVALPAEMPAQAVLAQLRSVGVYADARSQTLRMSPGVISTALGVQRLLAGLAGIRRG